MGPKFKPCSHPELWGITAYLTVRCIFPASTQSARTMMSPAVCLTRPHSTRRYRPWAAPATAPVVAMECHQVVIQYTPGAQNQPGRLQVWLDPTFIPGTQTPIPGAPTVLNVPYNIVYNTQNNPKGLQLTSDNKLWAGFTAAQPSSGGKRGGGGASGGTAITSLPGSSRPSRSLRLRN